MRRQGANSGSLFRSLQEDLEMAHRNSSQFGTLCVEGKPGQRLWKVRYFKNVLREGCTERVRAKSTVGPADGPGKLTRKQAQVLAWNLYVKHQQRGLVERICTLRTFYDEVFTPHMGRLKKGSQKDYETRWRNWVEPRMGDLQLQQIGAEEVASVVYAPLRDGRSVQTATHVRKLLQAVFTLAKRRGWFVGENPAADIELPEMNRREAYAYSPGQAKQILELLTSPIREAVLLSLTSGLTAAELRGLRWSSVNLSSQPSIAGGRSLPPLSLSVTENFYLGEYGSPKAKQRRRVVPLFAAVAKDLGALQESTRFRHPTDPIFASSSGKPFDTHNVSNRTFRKISERLGFPVGWHNLRHTHATWLDQQNISMADRVAQMGHASSAMTLHYSHSDLERRRGVIDGFAESLQTGSGKVM